MTPKPDLAALLPDEDAIRARRDALVSGLRPSRRRGGRCVRTRVLIAVAALFVAGGGAAWAAGAFSADDVDPKAGVTCYDRPDWQNATIFNARPIPSRSANVTGVRESFAPATRPPRRWSPAPRKTLEYLCFQAALPPASASASSRCRPITPPLARLARERLPRSISSGT